MTWPTLNAVWVDRNAVIRKLTIFTLIFSLVVYFGLTFIDGYEFFPFTILAQAVFLPGMSFVAYAYFWFVFDSLLSVNSRSIIDHTEASRPK